MYNEIKELYPDITDDQFRLEDDGSGAKIVLWTYPMRKPTKTQIKAVAVKAEITRLKKKVKKMANDKILITAPAWKQRNLIARSVELLTLDPTDPVVVAESDMMKAAWASLNAIRKHSNKLEDDLDKDVTTDITIGWPV